ncbi:MAG: SPOR domain-containing protein, partial [Desulfobulbales bacterium]|nr:SPOR domain-containing protein [Desulfobulbales bacterium]
MKDSFAWPYLPALIVLALLSAFLQPSDAAAAEQPLYYTIQAGSYLREHTAARLYHSLAESLAAGERDHLRIEKVAGYYAVRLGRFTARSGADKLLAAGGTKLPAGSLVLKAYIKPERISLLYDPLQPGETAAFAGDKGKAARKIPASAQKAAPASVSPPAEAETGADMVRPPGDPQPEEPERNTPPVLSINRPGAADGAVAENGPFSISYDLADPDNRVTVSFYYDTDNSGLDGIAIKGGCGVAPEGRQASCTWDTEGIAPGSYYIYG